jgi:hypothetical protein
LRCDVEYQKKTCRAENKYYDGRGWLIAKKKPNVKIWQPKGGPKEEKLQE